MQIRSKVFFLKNLFKFAIKYWYGRTLLNVQPEIDLSNRIVFKVSAWVFNRKKLLVFPTISVHFDLKTFPKATSLTLVPASNINWTQSFFFALVNQISPDASFEEATTPVASLYPVMFARCSISTNFTKDRRLCVWEQKRTMQYCKCNRN